MQIKSFEQALKIEHRIYSDVQLQVHLSDEQAEPSTRPSRYEKKIITPPKMLKYEPAPHSIGFSE